MDNFHIGYRLWKNAYHYEPVPEEGDWILIPPPEYRYQWSHLLDIFVPCPKGEQEHLLVYYIGQDYQGRFRKGLLAHRAVHPLEDDSKLRYAQLSDLLADAAKQWRLWTRPT